MRGLADWRMARGAGWNAWCLALLTVILLVGGCRSNPSTVPTSPKLAVLDETDSGLDIDALRVVAEAVNALRDPSRAMLVITHYQRLLDYIVPDRIHVLAGGRIVAEGGKELALELEAKGYEHIIKVPA